MLSQYGFPKEIDNKVDLQLPQFVKSHNVKVTPSNTSSIVTSPQGGGTGVADAIIPLVGTSQNVIFDIPVGIAGQFIDHRFTTLDFTVQYEVTTKATTTGTSAYLRSGAHAWFDRSQLISQSGLVLEDINLYGVVQDQINQLTMNTSDRDSLAMNLGLLAEENPSSNYSQGHAIASFQHATETPVGSSYYSYSIPLLSSLIGNQAKTFFDCRTNKLQLVLQTAAVVPVTLKTGTVSGSPVQPIVKMTLSNFSINMQYLDVGLEGLKMLNKVSGLQYFTGKTYKVATATLPNTAAGYNSILTGIRGSSVNSIITRVNENTLSLAACANGIYDSKMPAATAMSYSINGVAVPANPINVCLQPASAFSHLQHCTPSFYNMDFKSCAIPARYCNYLIGSTLPTGSDSRIATTASSIESLSQFAFGFSLERIASGGLLSGENLNSANTYLNINLNSSCTNNLTYIFIAKMDAIYILDPASGEISVRL